MAINRVLQSSVQNGLPKFDGVWDGTSAVGSMEPISAITLTGSQSSVQFNNIPQTYSHLQLRIHAQNSRTTTGYDAICMQFNGDTSSNYANHYMYGNGTSSISAAETSQTSIRRAGITSENGSTNIFGASIIDILDYTSTSKNKTTRSLYGRSSNASNTDDVVFLASGLWFATPAAITSIKLFDIGAYNFTQYSSFSLYGIK